mmetsp:Transcript_16442/g.38125  ORF Transcript_16442/g.38125 Transcript_16442/m.38125 type:complete len:203 (-) Transcript_16442:1970-2578(-)
MRSGCWRASLTRLCSAPSSDTSSRPLWTVRDRSARRHWSAPRTCSSATPRANPSSSDGSAKRPRRPAVPTRWSSSMPCSSSTRSRSTIGLGCKSLSSSSANATHSSRRSHSCSSCGTRPSSSRTRPTRVGCRARPSRTAAPSPRPATRSSRRASATSRRWSCTRRPGPCVHSPTSSRRSSAPPSPCCSYFCRARSRRCASRP